MRVSRPTTLSLGAALVATTIDLDGNHARRVRNLRAELARAMSFGPRIALGDQLGTDGFGQSPDVPTTDRHLGQ
jgi:hypothetical protein